MYRSVSRIFAVGNTSESDSSSLAICQSVYQHHFVTSFYQEIILKFEDLVIFLLIFVFFSCDGLWLHSNPRNYAAVEGVISHQVSGTVSHSMETWVVVLGDRSAL